MATATFTVGVMGSGRVSHGHVSVIKLPTTEKPFVSGDIKEHYASQFLSSYYLSFIQAAVIIADGK